MTAKGTDRSEGTRSIKDEYIRKQDAVNALDRIFDNVPMKLTTEILRLRRELRGLSPADVAPVVRCRDCKHYYFADNRIPQEQRYVCEISGEIWKPDDFCSYGEMKEKNNE